MKNIDIHADDFALSINSSKDIINCINKNKINSISIIPNMNCFSKCMKLLNNTKTSIEMSIHLNFLEGKSESKKELVNNLVDKQGYFKLSWTELFLLSYNPFKYKKIKNELKIEIKNQIEKLKPFIKSIRIDSHQHTHMIPIVFKSLMEVIDENNYKVEYIRISEEYNTPYFKNIFKCNILNFRNILCHIILNLLSKHQKKILKNKNIKFSSLWGIIMSGNMNYKRINILLNDFIAKSKNHTLEILFHPGTVLKEELTSEFTKKSFNKFHTSYKRKIEYETILNLKI